MTVTTGEILDKFDEWFREAEAGEPEYPNTMALATADASGAPSVRMVLLKGADERGFVFYTNLGSRKAKELNENPKASLCFHWKSTRCQIRIDGSVEAVSDDEADAYFASRPWDSRIGAWASKQSQPMEGRFVLEKRIAEYTLKFNVGEVPRPEFWSGYRVVPDRIEFWKEELFRLHDRTLYVRDGETWTMEKLFP